jgi:uncharacterized protein DUF3829
MRRRILLLPIVLLLTLNACDFRSLTQQIDEKIFGKPPTPPPVAAPTPPPPVTPPPPPATQPATLPSPTAETTPAPGTQPTTQPSTQPSSQPAAVTPGGTANLGSVPDDVIIDELNGYIECLNRTSPRTNDSRSRYLSWVNEKVGPTCTERYISYGLYTLYEDGVDKCNKAAQRGQAGPPSLPELEKAASDLAAAYAELVPLVQRAYDYYNQEDYKDDKCAKAQEMHPKLIQAFNRYREAAAKLQSGVDALKKDVDLRELARIEREEGRKLQWYVRKFGISAKELIQTVPEDNPLKMNKDAYLTAYGNLEKDYDALNTYAAANREETGKTFWFSAFENSEKDLYTKAKFLKRDLSEGKGAADVNKLNDLINEYNRFISDANNLKFKFP